MVAMKMTHMNHIPEYCDDCTYYGCRPHPYKGWTQFCELCMHCMDDDEPEDWIYDGNSRPKNCPLVEVEPQESKKVNCKSTKCENCINHNYCDYEPQESDRKCHTCKHYTSGENDGSCGSYICKGYSGLESEESE